MAESNSPTIRAVAWSEVFPWLSIVRAFRLAISLRALILGAMGILLTVSVWGVIGMTFGADPEGGGRRRGGHWVASSIYGNPWSELTSVVPNRPAVLDLPSRPEAWRQVEPVTRPWTLLSAPATARD